MSLFLIISAWIYSEINFNLKGTLKYETSFTEIIQKLYLK